MARKCFKCGTKVEKDMVYCPECGVNIDEYFKKNKKTLLLGKQPDDRINEPEPQIGTFTAICLIVCLFLPILGWIVIIFYLWTFNNRKKEWREKQILNEMQVMNKKIS